ncbi:7,8-dihydro-8-oxoguanine-triphosphatase [Vibrio sp. qd031]|uniref:8-oxo-dGTP diphosphatase MutT n=1 Tax=Vibrio sp. qd031 TaxID=1603038 RepID=UPI000A1180EF|nr:8-oxo-dGTP diphosphatase MutT [Vibrio sp. qd031]ORT48327.1 7,8-dihydro-8-oxoguanine-triphosphatase [Vibrio sp. qd031]
MKRIHIVAAIIFNPQKTEVFITQRPQDKHKGGYWEFPGGKVEESESVEQAIARELDEEIGIEVTEQNLFEHLHHDYPDKALTFDFITVTQFRGTPYGREGQPARWVAIEQLAQYEFPEANVPILHKVIQQYGK